MKIVKNLAMACLLAFVIALASCGSTGEIPIEWQEQYPLTDYVEVIESSRDQKSLFKDVQSYLIDNYRSSLEDYQFIYTEDDVISFKVNRGNPAEDFSIEFDVTIEFKESKMRLGLRNCYLGKWYIGGQTHTHTDISKPNKKQFALRQDGYKAYMRYKEDFITNLHKIAAGTYSSW